MAIRKYIAYTYSAMSAFALVTIIIAGAQSIKEKDERNALSYFGLATLVGLLIFIYMYIARMK